MDSQQWEQWKAAKDKRLRQSGEVMYLLDGNGVPLMEVDGASDVSAPREDGVESSLQVTVPIDKALCLTHPLLEELVADNLGQQESSGALKTVGNKSRFIFFERSGGIRNVYRVTHTVAKYDNDIITEIEVNGVDSISILSRLPAFSVRLSIDGKWNRLANDYAVQFERQRWIQTFQMAKVADGYTKTGAAADIITEIIQQSLSALYKAFGIHEDDAPYIVRRLDRTYSPEASITLADESILDTIKKAADSAGVGLTSTIIFPGEEHNIVSPTIVFQVTQR